MNDEKDLLAVLALSNSSNHVQAIITAPSDRGTLTIELGQKKFILQASQKSKAFNLYSETYHYKITDSLNNVIFEDTQFNFAKNSKDGIIIKSDSNVDFSDTTICYNLNGISGNLETIKCSELDSN
ncbi:hypothetical protein JWG40_15580 [Leptospira sp. 201903074]|uniref:hypothetical protein n=1 Tax=Leptospira abararensis TaxID=2810036 RepID=UPI0019646756|nr:hypothetical protein [Leptospira abararensis]MBM9548448.1 hypothetical protein [Leptospira abararensis]